MPVMPSDIGEPRLDRLPAPVPVASKIVDFQPIGRPMSVDKDTVRRIAKLSRIALSDDQCVPMAGKLNGIMAWVEQLNAVNVDGIAPMTSVVEQNLKMRADKVTEGGNADA